MISGILLCSQDERLTDEGQADVEEGEIFYQAGARPRELFTCRQHSVLSSQLPAEKSAGEEAAGIQISGC